MKSDRELAREITEYAFGRVSNVLQSKCPEHLMNQIYRGDESLAEVSQQELQEYVHQMLLNIDEHRDIAIMCLLRSTSSVRDYLPSWYPLLQKCIDVVTEKRGFDEMRKLLVGLVDKKVL